MRQRHFCVLAMSLIVGIATTVCQAQQMQQREAEFLTTKPVIGEQLPDLTIYAPDGSPFKTSDLRGHYTVLTFGCLT